MPARRSRSQKVLSSAPTAIWKPRFCQATAPAHRPISNAQLTDWLVAANARRGIGGWGCRPIDRSVGVLVLHQPQQGAPPLFQPEARTGPKLCERLGTGFRDQRAWGGLPAGSCRYTCPVSAETTRIAATCSTGIDVWPCGVAVVPSRATQVATWCCGFRRDPPPPSPDCHRRLGLPRVGHPPAILRTYTTCRWWCPAAGG